MYDCSVSACGNNGIYDVVYVGLVYCSFERICILIVMLDCLRQFRYYDRSDSCSCICIRSGNACSR